MAARQGSKNGLCGGRSHKTGALCRKRARRAGVRIIPALAVANCTVGAAKELRQLATSTPANTEYARLFWPICWSRRHRCAAVSPPASTSRVFNFPIVIEKLQANNLDVTKGQIKTLALEERTAKGEAKRAKRIEREPNGLIISDPDWLTILESCRVTACRGQRSSRSCVTGYADASADKSGGAAEQLQQAERHQVDLRLAKNSWKREEKPEGVGDAKQPPVQKFGCSNSGAIHGFATGLSGRSEHGGETRTAGTAEGVQGRTNRCCSGNSRMANRDIPARHLYVKHLRFLMRAHGSAGLFMAGNRCLSPWTFIQTPDGQSRPFAELLTETDANVLSWADGCERVGQITGGFVRGIEPAFRVVLDSGEFFDCSRKRTGY